MAVLVGQKAPHFSAAAVLDGNKIVSDFSLDQYIDNKYVVLFFYPKDFTFVCPTELHAFQEKIGEFEARGCAVVGCSTDTAESHAAYLRMPKAEGGIQGITYPLIADTAKTIATNFGVLGGDYTYNDAGELIFDGAPIAFRGTFLIDKEGIVRHEVVNFFPIGRSIDEELRTVDAWQYSEEHGEVCPANWQQGEEAMQATKEGVADYLSKN